MHSGTLVLYIAYAPFARFGTESLEIEVAVAPFAPCWLRHWNKLKCRWTCFADVSAQPYQIDSIITCRRQFSFYTSSTGQVRFGMMQRTGISINQSINLFCREISHKQDYTKYSVPGRQDIQGSW